VGEVGLFVGFFIIMPRCRTSLGYKCQNDGRMERRKKERKRKEMALILLEVLEDTELMQLFTEPVCTRQSGEVARVVAIIAQP
jgi:hypothetical protein